MGSFVEDLFSMKSLCPSTFSFDRFWMAACPIEHYEDGTLFSQTGHASTGILMVKTGYVHIKEANRKSRWWKNHKNLIEDRSRARLYTTAMALNRFLFSLNSGQKCYIKLYQYFITNIVPMSILAIFSNVTYKMTP